MRSSKRHSSKNANHTPTRLVSNKYRSCRWKIHLERSSWCGLTWCVLRYDNTLSSMYISCCIPWARHHQQPGCRSQTRTFELYPGSFPAGARVLHSEGASGRCWSSSTLIFWQGIIIPSPRSEQCVDTPMRYACFAGWSSQTGRCC